MIKRSAAVLPLTNSVGVSKTVQKVKMKHSVTGGAAALLEKSRSHMRGQHFSSEARGTSRNTQIQQKPTKKNEDEEDIAAYLSQLSKKIPGKSKHDDISSGLSDLSLSDHDVKQSTPMNFMKKSSTATSSVLGSSKSAQLLQQSTRTKPGKTSKSFTSSALERASKLNAKITSRKIVVESESSEDGSDKNQELDVTSSLPEKSEIRDKYRFLKKPLNKAVEPTANYETKGEKLPVSSTQSYHHVAHHERESRIMAESTKSKTGGRSIPLTPVKSTLQTSNSSPNVYTKIMAELDTDEENIDHLIGDMNESSSYSEVKEIKEVDQVSDDGLQTLSVNGYTEGNRKALSSDESSNESSIAEDVGLTLAGLQTIDDLLPPSPLYTHHRDSSPEQRNLSPNSDIESVKTVSPLAGLQTIDDLLPPSTLYTQHKDTSPEQSDLSHRTDIESVKSPSPLLVEESVSTIPDTPRSNLTADDSYSSVVSQSSKSSLSKSRSESDLSSSVSRRSRSTKISNSSIRTITPTRSVSYSHDFDTLSQSGDTLDDQTIASDSSTSHSESSSRSSQPSNVSKHRRQDAAVQTSGPMHAVNHHWLKDYDFQTPQYIKLLSANVKEPASHFVDPMVLQTLSSFDSSSLMLHTNLSEQVRQTRLAITNTLQQHQAFLDSLQEDYCYTTLENTKLFIKRQKKRRRKKEDPTETPIYPSL